MVCSVNGTGPPSPELNGVFLAPYDDGTRDGLDPSPASSGPLGGPSGRQGRILQSSETAGPEVILEDINLLPFDFLRTGDRVGLAVVKIERRDGAAGTGFLIAPGILLTNHHVLPDPAIAAQARAHANFEDDPPGDAAGRPAAVPLSPGSLFVANEELDFAFCGVEGLDFLGTVPLRRDSLSILPAEYVNIIQHPRGRPKQVALQDSQVVKVDSVVVHYCCDTEPGSSGSPVFNNRWHLVALHHASVVADGRRGRRVAGTPADQRFLNEGIRLSAIALWLESAEANTPELRPQVARVRSAFEDLDRQAGYFGALGRRAGRRSAAELVVESYRNPPGVLDLGFWNLAPIGDAIPEHMNELGRCLAEMGLDVWCLPHLKPSALRALIEHLDAHYRLDYRLAIPPASPGGEADVAILYRHDPRRSVRWSGGAGEVSHAVIGERGPSAPSRIALVPAPREGHAPGRDDPPRTPRGPGPGLSGADLVLIGDGVRSRDVRALARLGPDFRAAIGRDGGLAIAPAPGSALGPAFVSPNLDRTLSPSDDLVVAHDRRWPSALAALDGHPIAVRLTFRPGGSGGTDR